ncbi:hypothetical protein T484DRAFT_3199784 [Baffinella frigidus]|nr:hypothetical protein T484DRAFT_3199784 [Cryptophyta sp. CCMP2293]
MCSLDLYPRWREARAREAAGHGFTAEERQWLQEYDDLSRAASRPRESLEQTHVWALAHVLKRPVIVYGVDKIKNWKEEVVANDAGQQGIYLPWLCDRNECSQDPIALAYIRGHYLALVGEEASHATNKECAGHTSANEKGPANERGPANEKRSATEKGSATEKRSANEMGAANEEESTNEEGGGGGVMATNKEGDVMLPLVSKGGTLLKVHFLKDCEVR